MYPTNIRVTPKRPSSRRHNPKADPLSCNKLGCTAGALDVLSVASTTADVPRSIDMLSPKGSDFSAPAGVPLVIKGAGSVLPTWIGTSGEDPKLPERSPAKTTANAIAALAAAARNPTRGAGDHHGLEGSGTQDRAGTGMAKLLGAGTVGIARRTPTTARSSSIS